jgi:hypothetical protein
MEVARVSVTPGPHYQRDRYYRGWIFRLHLSAGKSYSRGRNGSTCDSLNRVLGNKLAVLSFAAIVQYLFQYGTSIQMLKSIFLLI